MPLGIYISVPFCRTKCTFCNFASGVVSRAVFERYTDRVCADIASSESLAEQLGARFDRHVDSIYLGGGTPTVLDPQGLECIFSVIRTEFTVDPGAEVTVECAPGTLKPGMLDALLRCGVNRVSLGVQSFVDKEARSVGRLHTRAIVLDDLLRLRAAGIHNISLDLIAGLPHQTAESWRYSLNETIASGVPHVSIYMLEVDEDSRLGNELLAGGARYHAHFVPDDDATAGFYLAACETMESSGIHQYEISNFARETADAPHPPGVDGCASFSHSLPHYHSSHNLKYWTRQPYLGFGVDAHSMLPTTTPGFESVRLATPDTLEQYLAAAPPAVTQVTPAQALEERIFLGLRLNRGICLHEFSEYNASPSGSPQIQDTADELRQESLLEIIEDRLRLTARGRLLSNEVFAQFLSQPELNPG